MTTMSTLGQDYKGTAVVFLAVYIWNRANTGFKLAFQPLEHCLYIEQVLSDVLQPCFDNYIIIFVQFRQKPKIF